MIEIVKYRAGICNSCNEKPVNTPSEQVRANGTVLPACAKCV